MESSFGVNWKSQRLKYLLHRSSLYYYRIIYKVNFFSCSFRFCSFGENAFLSCWEMLWRVVAANFTSFFNFVVNFTFYKYYRHRVRKIHIKTNKQKLIGHFIRYTCSSMPVLSAERIYACRRGQDDLPKFKLSIRMWDDDVADFECGVILERLIWVSQNLPGFSHTSVYRVNREWFK